MSKSIAARVMKLDQHINQNVNCAPEVFWCIFLIEHGYYITFVHIYHHVSLCRWQFRYILLFQQLHKNDHPFYCYVVGKPGYPCIKICDQRWHLGNSDPGSWDSIHAGLGCPGMVYGIVINVKSLTFAGYKFHIISINNFQDWPENVLITIFQV